MARKTRTKNFYYCPYCEIKDRKLMAGQGIHAHQRVLHPGRPFLKVTSKNAPVETFKITKKDKKEKEPVFVLEPAEGAKGSAARGYDAEFRLRIVLRIDVEK